MESSTAAAGGEAPRLSVIVATRDRPEALARAVASMEDGRTIRYAGLVICRQRPGTASGVVFMTLEDETGFVNAILWSRVFEEHTSLAKTASFLGITGTLQRQDTVVHLIADELWPPQVRRPPRAERSRDFR